MEINRVSVEQLELILDEKSRWYFLSQIPSFQEKACIFLRDKARVLVELPRRAGKTTVLVRHLVHLIKKGACSIYLMTPGQRQESTFIQNIRRTIALMLELVPDRANHEYLRYWYKERCIHITCVRYRSDHTNLKIEKSCKPDVLLIDEAGFIDGKHILKILKHLEMMAGCLVPIYITMTTGDSITCRESAFYTQEGEHGEIREKLNTLMDSFTKFRVSISDFTSYKQQLEFDGIGDWRPWTANQFPFKYRKAIRTILVMSRVRIPQQRRKEIISAYPHSCLDMLPLELIHHLFEFICSSDVAHEWM